MLILKLGFLFVIFSEFMMISKIYVFFILVFNIFFLYISKQLYILAFIYISLFKPVFKFPSLSPSYPPSAPSCAPSGVSCRSSGRGGVRVWWSPPPNHCTHAPVSGYTVVATPTRHTHRGHHSHHSSKYYFIYFIYFIYIHCCLYFSLYFIVLFFCSCCCHYYVLFYYYCYYYYFCYVMIIMMILLTTSTASSSLLSSPLHPSLTSPSFPPHLSFLLSFR